MAHIPRLHLISDLRFCSDDEFVDIASQVCQAGVDAVHFRDRSRSAAGHLDMVRRLRDALDDCGSDCRVIMNDRVDVAALSGSDGVQLPESGIPADLARTLLPPPCLIGASVHSLEAAYRAEAAGADYLLAGHVFDTASKAGTPGRGITFIREVVDAVELPVIAIGGINVSNARSVLEAGARGIAVISAILDSDDPERSATELRKLIEEFEAVAT